MRSGLWTLVLFAAIFICVGIYVFRVGHYDATSSSTKDVRADDSFVVRPKLVSSSRAKRSIISGSRKNSDNRAIRSGDEDRSKNEDANRLSKHFDASSPPTVLSTRRNQDERDNDFYLYSLSAFDDEIFLNLSRFSANSDNGLILAPNFVVQHYNSDNFTWIERQYDDDGKTKNDSVAAINEAAGERAKSIIDRCLFSGRVVTANGSNVASNALLNLCRGMYGTLELPRGTYFLEPLGVYDTFGDEKNGEKKKVAGDVYDERDQAEDFSRLPDDQPHLLYRFRSQTFHDHHREQPSQRRSPSISSSSKARSANKQTETGKRTSANVTSQHGRPAETIPSPNGFWREEVDHHAARYKRSYSWDHFIEVMVVADARMKQYHRSNLENYILTLLSIVATIYRHPSLEAALNIVVVKIIILDSDNAGPRISENAQETLKQFCRWQQSLNDPDDDSVNHHDVAILLTRHDICRAPGKCDTLGLAELGTMCDSYRSCAIIEDNGLSAAFTIAHELGHIFNIPHDDEKKCGHHMALDKSNFHIMAPTLEFNTHPWSWSTCSSALLHKFLDSGRAHCLLDKPAQQKYVETMAGNPAPGLTFTVDQQCQFVFGSSATLCPYMPTCKRLWCATVYQYQVGCRTQHMPWADGTPCGYNRWCYRGECVGVSPMQMTPVEGGWGIWKDWGECSRSCGGGVKRSLRDCDNPKPSNGGRYCVGERVRFRPCNTKECPLDAPDYRAVQCADFNMKRVGIHGLASDNRWVPKYSGVNPAERCKLYCRVAGSAAFYMLKDRVVDGTPCGRYTDDICVDGACRKAGCDHRLNSSMKRDDCGVCGGDGSTCRRVTGSINEPQSYGYNKVLRVPAGASSIDIRQRSWSNRPDDDNYLALTNSKGEWILNGDYQISAYHVEIPVRGTVLHYSGSDSPVERLNTSRPAMEDLFIHVLSVGQLRSPDVHYDYVINERPTASMQAPDYFWRTTDEYSECTKPCHGTQSKRAICVDAYEEEQVHEKRCDGQLKPDAETRVCNIHCQLKWLTESISECSVACGSGEQSQRSMCVNQMSSGGSPQVVDDRYCYDMAKPSDRVACYKDCAGRHWLYSDWESCSVSCGGGKQLRTSSCADQNNMRLDNRYCENIISDTLTQDCNMFPCPSWQFGEWSKCSYTCDGGTQVRHAWCQDAAGREIDVSFCSANQRLDRRKCNEQLCAMWKFSAWSDCSKTCGDGVASRDAWCVDSKGNQLDEQMCDKTQKIVSKACRLATCPHWKMSDWSQCSRTCLDGWMSRRVLCVDSSEQEIDNSFCLGPGEQPPPTHQACNHGPCPFWKTGDWSSCSVTCGGGLQQRNVECSHRGEVVDNGYCHDQQRPDQTQKCTLIACPQWEMGTWEACSVSCGEGNYTRTVKCRYPDNGPYADDAECKDKKPKPYKACKKSACPTTTTSTTTTTTTVTTTTPTVTSTTRRPTTPAAPAARVASKKHTTQSPIFTTSQSQMNWVTGAWTQCSKTCDGGERMRYVACRDIYSRILNDIYCRHLAKPIDRELCNQKPCVIVGGEWHVGAWEPCPTTCGEKSYATRRVTCIAPNSASGNGALPATLDRTRCDAKTRPVDRHICRLAPCPTQSPRTASHPKPPERNRPSGTSWRVGDWGQCNKSCGGGVQRRLVDCVNTETGQRVPNQNCVHPPPPPSQSCNTQKCRRLIWHTGKWSSCSATCGRGVRSRDVRCVDEELQQVGGEGQVNDTLCAHDPDGVIGPKPPTYHRCRLAKCPRWRRGKWTACSVTCGEGARTRTVVCAQDRGTVLSDSHCVSASPKPVEAARCQRTPCPVYLWLTTRWTKCSELCGEGRQFREVYCINNYRQRAPPHSCSAQQKPTAVQNCVGGMCPYTWAPGSWSACSKTCGDGEQFRSLYCQLKGRPTAAQSENAVTQAGYVENGPQVPIGHCAALPKPPVRLPCSHGSCESSYFWHASAWSECSVPCGWGLQTRRVRCLSKTTRRFVRGRCTAALRPKRKRRCFLRNCEASDCVEARQMFNTTSDGTYGILVSGRMVQIYCHGMNESHPKEYLSLPTGQRTNYAEFYGRRLLYPHTCPHNGQRNDSCECISDSNPKPGMTRFTKVRIDLQNMKINIMDRQYAMIEYGDFVPYGTAGDCYSSVNCPQGQFSVDLRQTGFKVSPRTEWQEDGHKASKLIVPFEHGAAIQGRCGGYCGKCFPNRRNGLMVELDSKQLPP